MRKYRFLIVPLLCAAIVLILLRTVIFIGYVPSGSMEPTIKADSLIIASRIYGELKNGDIIVFKHDGKQLVKRIAAVADDSITIGDMTYIIPEDSYFVLGDNYENSYDSRYWTEPYVKKKDVIAKLFKN